jgi:hypothetical protein
MKRVPDQDNRPVSFCTNHATTGKFCTKRLKPVLALNWLTRTRNILTIQRTFDPLRKEHDMEKIQHTLLASRHRCRWLTRHGHDYRRCFEDNQTPSLGGNLLDEMRFDRQGNEIADFVLNKPAYREALCWSQATISGCGSREHAPWAIADFGIAA